MARTETIRGDLIDILSNIPDKYFDLIIADPPYFKGPNLRQYYGKYESTTSVKRTLYPKLHNWESPDVETIDEMIRVSKNQIIWGCNYYEYNFAPGRIIWDKVNGSSSFSDCEIAYCSLHNSVRLFRYMWNGMMQGKSISEGWIQRGNKRENEKRIHPTQKPIDLYRWILLTYAKPGDIICDPYMGSGSSRIAAYELDINYIGIEIDKVMFDLQENRFKNYLDK